MRLAAESKTALEKVNVRLPDVIVRLFEQRLRSVLVFDIAAATAPLEEAGAQPIGFSEGVLNLGRPTIRVVSVRSVPSQLQAEIVLESSAAITLKP